MNKCRIALALSSALLAACSGSEESSEKATELPENKLSVSTTMKVNELEGSTAMHAVKFTLARAAEDEIKVRYAIRHIETDERDLNAITENVFSIAEGQKTAQLEIPILNDDFDEIDESFEFEVLGADIPVQGATKATITVIDSDPEPIVSFAHITDGYSVIAEGTGDVSVKVKLSHPSQKTITVPYSFSGLATIGTDVIVQEPLVLNFNSETTEQNIQLSFPQDDLPEGGESLFIKLNTATNAQVSQNQSDTYSIIIPGDIRLNDTGVTSYIDSKGAVVDFTPSGMSGQDADFGEDHKNAQHFDGYAGFSFTKIDRAGNPLASDNLGFSCVKDNATGLTWEVKSPEQMLPYSTGKALREELAKQLQEGNYSYSASHANFNATNYRYYFFEPNTKVNGDSAGAEGDTFVNSRYPISNLCAFPDQNSASYLGGTASRCNTKAYIDAFNALGICGAKDWRLPTIEELRSIHNYEISQQHSVFMPDARNDSYISATPYVDGTAAVWCLNRERHQVQLCNKQEPNFVRLVRSETSEE